MTDYKSEQLNEVEVLQSIYPDELSILQTEPYHQILIDLTPEASNDEDNIVSVTLKFTYIEKYPDELPVMEIEDSTNLDDEEHENLLTILEEQGQENVGMPMLFMMCSATLEWLISTMETKKSKRVEEKEKLVREEEEAELKRFEGTRVTIETFVAWKANFDAELLSRNKKIKNENITKKSTGRELFENNQAMDDDQDISFLQEGEDNVKVDESLFEELDDLDLEEDLDT